MESSFQNDAKDAYDEEVAIIKNLSQHAQFLAGYEDLLQARRDIEREQPLNAIDRMTIQLNNLWTDSVSSALFHPPYTVQGEDGSPVTLEDTLTPLFTINVGESADAPPFTPILFTMTPRGTVKEIVDVMSIRRQYENIFAPDTEAGAEACIETFLNYFKEEAKERKKFQKAELELAKVKFQQRLRMGPSLSTGGPATEDDVVSRIEIVQESAERNPKTSDMLAIQQRLDAADDMKKLDKLRAKFLLDTRNEFYNQNQVKTLVRKRIIFLRDHARNFQAKLDRIYQMYQNAGNNQRTMEMLAQKMQETQEQRDTEVKDFEKRYEENLDILKEQWVALNNLTLEAPSAGEVSSAAAGVEALNVLSGGIDVDESTAIAQGAEASTVNDRGEKQWRLGRRSTRQKRSRTKALSRYAQDRKRNFMRRNNMEAEILMEKISRYNLKLTSLRNAYKDNESMPEGREKSSLQENYMKRIEKYEKRLRKAERELELLNSGGATTTTVGNDPMDVDDDTSASAAAAQPSPKKRRRKKVVEKPIPERLTASFGTTAEVIPDTILAAAEVSIGKTPTVVKRKKKPRKKKQKSAPKNASTTLEAGTLRF